MSRQITITLPDHIAERISEWAAFTQQDMSDMLTTAIDVSLPELSTAPISPVSELDDESILELTSARLDEATGKRLNDLFLKQQESVLTNTEREELLSLMQKYHILWVRQAQALAEAVGRGLIPPLAA